MYTRKFISGIITQRFRVLICVAFGALLGIFLFNKTPIELLPKLTEQKVIIFLKEPGDPSSPVTQHLEQVLREAILKTNCCKRVEAELSINSLVLKSSLILKEKNVAETLNLAIRDALSSNKIEKNFSIFTIDVNSLPIMDIIVDADQSNSLEELNFTLNENLVPELEKLPSVAYIEKKGISHNETFLVPKVEHVFVKNFSPLDLFDAVTNALKPSRYVEAPSIGNIKFSDREEDFNFDKTKIKLENGSSFKDLFIISEKGNTEVSSVLHNNRTAALLSIYKVKNINEIETSRQVKEVVTKLNKTFATNRISIINDSSNYISAAQANVIDNLKWGIIYTCLCVLILVRKTLYTMIISLTIPICLSLSFLFFPLCGITRNVMSLAAIDLIVGVVVDAGISVLDEMEEFRGKGLSPFEAALKAALSNLVPVVMTAFTTLAVFVPILFLNGKVGELFKDLSATVIICQIIAFFVAILVVPCIASIVYESVGTSERLNEKNEEKEEHGLSGLFTSVTKKCLEAPILYWVVPLAFLLLALWSVVIIPPMEFLPKRTTNEYKVRVLANGEISAGSLLSKCGQLDVYLQKKNSNDRLIVLDPDSSVTAAFTLQKPLDSRELTEMESNINTIFSPFISQIAAKNPIDKNSSEGRDLEFYLSPQANEIKGQLKKLFQDIPGVVHEHWSLDDHSLVGRVANDKPTAISIPIPLQESSTFNMLTYSPLSVGLQVNSTANGLQASLIKMLPSTEVFLHPFLPQKTVPGLNEFLVETKNINSSTIFINGRISERVTIQIRNKTVGEVSGKIDEILKRHHIPVDWGEDKLENEASVNNLLICFGVAAMLIVIMLILQSRSLVSTITILFTFIWGLIGSFPGLVLHAETLNASAIIGFILLAGTIINNGILLMDLISRRRRQQFSPKECCIYAVKHRTIPVLVTSLTTAIGMLPMVFNTGEGSQMYRSLSIVVVYGTIISTPLSLIGIPCLVLIFYDIKEMFSRAMLKLKIDLLYSALTKSEGKNESNEKA